MPPLVSVIVPTKNEAHNIPRLLASIPAEVELIVCDASSDETRRVVRAARPARTVVLDAPGTIAAARQLGASASQGDLLVFTDADVAFDAAYFSRLLTHADVDGVCGAKRSHAEYAGYYELVVLGQSMTHRWLGLAGASGSNMAMQRPAFEALGGFRTELRCNEDTELFLRAGRRGFQVRFDEQLVVWAFDHRRLRAGRGAKTCHSLVRNVLLYLTCCRRRLPRLLERDWGYWAPAEDKS